jgi:hypothetical protein
VIFRFKSCFFKIKTNKFHRRGQEQQAKAKNEFTSKSAQKQGQKRLTVGAKNDEIKRPKSSPSKNRGLPQKKPSISGFQIKDSDNLDQ